MYVKYVILIYMPLDAQCLPDGTDIFLIKEKMEKKKLLKSVKNKTYF